MVADERSWYLCLKLGACHLNYNKVQNIFLLIVNNIYFELFISFCIVFNTIVMAIQYHGQPKAIDDLQEYTNYVSFITLFYSLEFESENEFVEKQVVFGIFVIEAVFKIIALGRLYFLDAVNWFDLLILALSIVDFSVPNLNGLTVFRAFRLVICVFS